MTSTSRLSKLAELRAKTDQELVKIINNELDLGLQFALIAERRKSIDDFDSMEPPRMRAEKAYAEALKFFPYVDDLSEQRRLEGKVKQLRQALDRLSGADELRVQATHL